MKTILAIISPFRANQYDFNNLRLPKKDSGYEVVFVSDTGTLEQYLPPKLREISRSVDMVNYNEHVRFLSLPDIEEVIKEYLAKGNSVFLHSEEEMFLDDVARLNDKYSLGGISLEETQKFRNKYIMKEEISKFPYQELFILPKFVFANSTTEFPANLTFPVICKPLNLAGTLGVKKCNNLIEFQDYQKNNSGDFICEEYIVGDFYHCDALVIDKAIHFMIAGRYFAPMDTATIDLNYIGSEVYSNTSLFDKLYKATFAVVEALNIPNGLVHAEYLVNDNGVFFVEIGKRPAGAWIASMYDTAYKFSLFNYHLESQYLPADEFDVPKHQHEYSAGVQLLLPKSGILNSVELPSDLCSEFKIKVRDHKIDTNQVKTLSMLDDVAEVVFFADSKQDYDFILSSLIKNSIIKVR